MKTKQTVLYGLITVLFALVLSLTDCDNGTTHNHEWEWVKTTAPTLTADGLATETCKTCGETSGNTRPIAKLVLVPKTYTITLRNGQLVFTVEYKALETDTEPAYLTYMKTRL